MKQRSIASRILSGLLLMGLAGTASAVIVTPGATVPLSGTTAAANPFLAGTVLIDESYNFSLPVSQTDPSLITGSVQQRIVRETASGTLDFYWRITNLQGGSLGYFRVGNFVDSVYDADYRLDGLGDVGPTSITRFTAGMGGAINDYSANFNFSDAAGRDTLAGGQESYFMFLHTDATNYAKTAFFDLASTGTFTASQEFSAYAPAVPEPEIYGLMLVGMGLLWVIRQRRSDRRPRAA